MAQNYTSFFEELYNFEGMKSSSFLEKMSKFTQPEQDVKARESAAASSRVHARPESSLKPAAHHLASKVRSESSKQAAFTGSGEKEREQPTHSKACLMLFGFVS